PASVRYVPAARIPRKSRSIPGQGRNAFSRRFPTLSLEPCPPVRQEFPSETWIVWTLASVVHSQKRAGTPRGSVSEICAPASFPRNKAAVLLRCLSLRLTSGCAGKYLLQAPSKTHDRT